MSSEARRAVVTGSSSGIGLCVAQTLLGQGWQVAGFDIAPPRISHPGFSQRAALTSADGAATDAAAQAWKGAHALVHAAGVLRVAPLGELRAADGELMWRLHVDAASRIAAVLVPEMARNRDGRVVLVGSRVSRGIAGRSQYAATKAALASLARSWAAETVRQWRHSQRRIACGNADGHAGRSGPPGDDARSCRPWAA